MSDAKSELTEEQKRIVAAVLASMYWNLMYNAAFITFRSQKEYQNFLHRMEWRK